MTRNVKGDGSCWKRICLYYFTQRKKNEDDRNVKLWYVYYKEICIWSYMFFEWSQVYLDLLIRIFIGVLTTGRDFICSDFVVSKCCIKVYHSSIWFRWTDNRFIILSRRNTLLLVLGLFYSHYSTYNTLRQDGLIYLTFCQIFAYWLKSMWHFSLWQFR